MALTKADLTQALYEVLGLSKREAREIVDLFFEEISQALASGEPVKLTGFGKFGLRDKGERPGRNPRTGEPVPIQPRRVVTFKAGQKLKSRIEAYAGDER